MDPADNQEPNKPLKAWKSPTLRKLGELTEAEIARLQAVEDPISLLFEIRPELKSHD